VLKSQHASGNLLIDRLFGAEIVYVADRKDRDRILQETFKRSTNEGKKTLSGAVRWIEFDRCVGICVRNERIMDQKASADWIVFATSSGGTHAGLLLGQRTFGFQGKSWESALMI